MAGILHHSVHDPECRPRRSLRAAFRTRRAIAAQYESPSGQVPAVEEAIESDGESHIPHQVSIELQGLLAGRKTILFQEVGHDVQVLFHAQPAWIVSRLGCGDLVEQVIDRVPALWTPR